MSHQLLRKILNKSTVLHQLLPPCPYLIHFYQNKIIFSGYVLPRFLHALPAATNSAGQQLSTMSDPKPSKSDEPITIENPYKKDKVQCILCRLNLEPNYKNVRLLSQFQSSYTGRIYGRHITGLCEKQHRMVSVEIRRAQDAGHMPIYNKAPEFLRDPKLFDPERPLRPHKY